MNNIETLNQQLFLAVNADGTAHSTVVGAAIVVADYLIYLVPVLLLALWFWGTSSSRNLTLKAVAVSVLALGIGQVIGLVWPHPRPFMIGIGRTLVAHAPDASFPSDHGTVFSAVSLCLFFSGEWVWGLAVLVVGVCVAWSRIYLGVHFPLDMIGAVGVSLLSYMLVNPAWQRAGRSITAQTHKLYRWLFREAIARSMVKP
jgi:undecaprenyl-diphosphatase